MKRFETFGDYMFALLFAPLKKGRRASNQFSIFFRVIGRIFDEMKQDVFRVRSEADIVSASPVMLPVHGQDRAMVRLLGEGDEAYRTRLCMKGIVAAKAGTREGVLLALTALGYEQSYIEPFWMQDPDRWAEFIIFLRGEKQSGVTDLRVIDAEVMEVKEGSSKPAYGIDAGNVVEIASTVCAGLSWYPRCNEIVCGVFPYTVNVGYLIAGDANAESVASFGEIPYPLVGQIAASEKFYHRHIFAMYEPLTSQIEVSHRQHSGDAPYPVCARNTYLTREEET